MRFSAKAGRILAISLLTAECFGISQPDLPQYLAKEIQDNPPTLKGLTPYPTHGPYSKRVAHVEIGPTRAGACSLLEL
jgi:hypothetical protein